MYSSSKYTYMWNQASHSSHWTHFLDHRFGFSGLSMPHALHKSSLSVLVIFPEMYRSKYLFFIHLWALLTSLILVHIKDLMQLISVNFILVNKYKLIHLNKGVADDSNKCMAVTVHKQNFVFIWNSLTSPSLAKIPNVPCGNSILFLGPVETDAM